MICFDTLRRIGRGFLLAPVLVHLAFGIARAQDSEEEREREDIRGRDEWFYGQRSFPSGVIPAGARGEAIRQMKRLEAGLAESRKNGPSFLSSSRWECIGPFNVAGRVNSLAVHPTEDGTVFAGAAAGGVWKSDNGSTTWTPLFDNESAFAMGSVAIDPSNPQVIYAATGEYLQRNSQQSSSMAYFGDGVYKSTNGGQSWQNIGLNSVGAFSKIHVSPRNPKLVFAGGVQSSAGFYRSNDGGMTWTTSMGGDVNDIALNPRNAAVVYAATTNAIFRSEDSGATFKNITGSVGLAGFGRVSLALAPSDTNRLYALVERFTQFGESSAFYVSTDRGNSWQHRGDIVPGFFGGQGFFNNCLAVDPFDADVVMAGGIDIYRSGDGGRTWGNTTYSYSGGIVHPDQHAIAFDPNVRDRVYIGNDGGIYRSDNSGADWMRISISMPITQFYGLDIDQDRADRVFGGTQDNGTVGALGGDFDQEWPMVLGGDGFEVVVDPNDPRTVYGEMYYGPLFRMSGPGLASTHHISSDIDEIDPGSWSTPIAFSYADYRTLYTGRLALYRTSNPTDWNPTWERLDPGNAANISAIGLSPIDENKIVVGSSAGEVRFTTDGGETWRGAAGTPGRFVTSIMFDPEEPARVYATFSGFGGGHVYRSDDNGATFVDISANLPRIPTNTIEIDPYDTRRLYVGTDIGVFVTLDGGNLWLPFNDGLPCAPVQRLRLHREGRWLVAATHGRSIYRINIDEGQPQPMVLSPLAGDVVRTPGALSISWAGLTGKVRVRISYDGGLTYTTIADSIDASAISSRLSPVKSGRAFVKVEELAGGRAAVSGAFQLTAESNAVQLGKRGFHAEALAVRNGYLWASSRGSDSIHRLKLPLLTAGGGSIRTSIEGSIVDMAYDGSTDRFIALVADASFGNPRLVSFDTTGTSSAPVALALPSAIGISMSPRGLAVIAPGPTGRVHFVDQTTGAVTGEGPAPTGIGDGVERVSLECDSTGFVQGVNDATDDATFAAELQRFDVDAAAPVAERMPMVVASTKSISFVGLAYDPGSGAAPVGSYFASDTAGVLYRILQGRVFASVDAPVVTGAVASIAITEIAPNPTGRESFATFTLARAERLTIELYRESGERISIVEERAYEPGTHRIALGFDGQPSGMYYFSLRSSNGERVVKGVVVMR